MIKIIRHYSPYLHRNYLYVRVWKWWCVIAFDPNLVVKPFPDRVQEYK